MDGVRSMMIALEARAPALNRLRSWRLSADQDLFGQWQAVVTFGRIGRRGQVRRHAFDDEAGLSRFVRCARLLTAQKRHAEDRCQLRSGASVALGSTSAGAARRRGRRTIRGHSVRCQTNKTQRKRTTPLAARPSPDPSFCGRCFPPGNAPTISNRPQEWADRPPGTQAISGLFAVSVVCLTT